MAQVTDAHLCECDDRDPHQREYLRGLNHKLGGKARYYFDLVFAELSGMNLDFIALTGDQMNSPTQANWDALTEKLRTLSVPYGLTFGNHDWDWPEGGTYERRPTYRSDWWQKHSSVLDKTPSFEVFSVSGVNLVFLDNSDYQVSDEQLAKLKAIETANVPSLLFFHIPVSVPSLRPATIVKWGFPILCGETEWKAEDKDRWSLMPYDYESTGRFYRHISQTRAFEAVFSGHLHLTSDDVLPSGVRQFVTPALYDGFARIITLKPA
ncbi:MAG TPA: metallophosphoesterase [Opitutaceae bacterium]|nr:metallophosphoesterase [Opitutaceae bacterium]